MENLFSSYLQSISSKFSREQTSEMGYRTEFETLLKGIFGSMGVKEIDHDAKARQGNKPDFVVIKNDVPILYIEAKDIGVSLDKVEKSEQMARYYGYTNLVLTDYIEFRFYRNGERYEEPIKVAEFDIKNRSIATLPKNYERVAKTLLDFTQSQKEPIKSGKHLAKIMGGKAQRIRDNLKQFLTNESEKNLELVRVYKVIKKMLVHDLTSETFADMYAQTLTYGLFVARYNDESPLTFTRQEARDLVPKSNPLLQHFFDHIVGADFDKRLEHIVDELCEVFQHANIKNLVDEYMSDADPIIHFYEDFLKEYDPILRKKMGAYYTPLPVVRFIVRAVDDILKRDFSLLRGLSETTKHSSGLHKVQVLDPAVGTGTFLSEVIDTIHKQQLKTQGGSWPSYVHHDLLPRIFGFELMMAPYTIAHLKISMKLQETGFKYFNETREGKTRLKVYLTNSLEDAYQQEELLAFDFGEAIAKESQEALEVKNKKPIMVVMGNPPYSVSSSNKGTWIQNLTQDYKKDLNERNIQPLSDDYIKFIRFAEHFIEKNGTGIVAMITNNSFIDGITHRQMRKHLLETFDDIYIFNLHGNSNIQEDLPDEKSDDNVFDIQQGVSINIFVRKKLQKKGLGNVHHAEVYGSRFHKFEALNNNKIGIIKWKRLDCADPYYFFVPKDFESESQYEKGFNVSDLFNQKTVGCVTSEDAVFLADDERLLRNQISKKFKDLLINNAFIKDYLYRPFDSKKIYYDVNLLGRARERLFRQFEKKNTGLIISKQFGGHKHFIVFLTKSINDKSSQPFAPYYTHPLYIYLDDGSKKSNLKEEIVNEIEKVVGKVSPEDVFDYIYAVLYSPNYGEKYKEFLKIDFPRVPYPKDKESFRKLVRFGTELRELHLLESPKVNKFITTYPVTGSDTVDKVSYNDGKVFINSEQYFGKVPEIAWNFYIGGYQPAQKWLKDRKARILTNSDIEHYQKIIVVLTETDRIMKEIDEVKL